MQVVYDDDDYHHYIYGAAGERVIKGESEGQRIFVNGQWAAGSDDFDDYTIYVNPYLVLQEEGYSKHYFIEGQRIASFVGEEWEEYFSRSTGLHKAGDDQVNYPAKTERLLDGMERHLAALGVEHPAMDRSQRPPKGGGSSGESEEDEKDEDEENEEEEEENEEGEEGDCHGDDDEEGGLYFYHPDHLGSTSYITDASGEVTQHIEYMAFGELFVEEGEDDDIFGDDEGVRYLFNAKELDEETGLYYYGARYYGAQISFMLSVDRFAEKYPGISPYSYVANSPINYTDPTGDTIVVNQTGYIVRNDKTDLLVFSKDKEGNLTALGELGKDVDINNIYSNLLDQNIEEADGIWNPYSFKNKVKGGGEWDLKANEKTIYGLANKMANEGKINQTQFLFEGERMEAQDIGNHHFGVVGKAYGLFTEQLMLKRAGKAQMNSGTSKPEWQKYKTETFIGPSGILQQRRVILPPYGDDPRDQRWIKSGFNYYDNR